MEIEQWWSGLDPRTQQWLFDHNGEAISSEVLVRIVEAGGPATSDAWWSHEDGPTGFFLPDEAVDWVETLANEEHDGSRA